jgi:hypothetical protein
LRDDYDEEKILTIGNTFLVNTFLLLKFGNQKKYVELNYARFFTFDPQYWEAQAYKELVKIVVRYMLAIKTLEKEKFIELTNKLPEDMKNLVEEDYNYFQLDGIIEGQRKKENEAIKACFEDGISVKRIARIFKLTAKEVEFRIKDMKATKPSRMQVITNSSN